MTGKKIMNWMLGGLLACSLLVSTYVYADSDDHEQARQALAAGKVMSLRDVLEKVEKEYRGQIVKVEFEHDDDKGAVVPWQYEIKLLQDSGDMLKLLVNAENGKILKAKGKNRRNKQQEKD